MSETRTTWIEECQIVADAWNAGKCETKLTAEDIFSLDPKELWFLPYLFAVAKGGHDNLVDLLISDPFYAKLFYFKIEEVKKRNEL